MNSYPPQYNAESYYGSTMAATATRISGIMKRVYVNMTLALIVTALVSMFCANSASYLNFMVTNSWFMWVLIIAEFGIVIGVSAGINKLSTATASFLFYLFAIVNGLLLSPIFLLYTSTSIAKTFFITAGTFAAMSIYGYTTNRDLTKVGNFLFMALIGLIIASVVNIFAGSETLGWIISFVGVLIFVGLTAWDTWQIKKMAAIATQDSYGRLAVLGALNLYIDFINLFLYLLRFFGNGRD